MASTSKRESELYRQLDFAGKRRYREKLDLLGLDTDPYLTAPDVWTESPELWPDVSFPDICTYLLFSPSPCTRHELKAYKSTEAWRYVTSGYVRKIKLLKLCADACLVTAKVKHSQKMNDPPLVPWIYCGTVACAHCNCMAGAEEACSHVAALLYSGMAKVNLRKQSSCTSEKCSWIVPSQNPDTPFAKVSDIQFASPLSQPVCTVMM